MINSIKEIEKKTGYSPLCISIPITIAFEGIPLMANYVGDVNEDWIGIHYAIAENAKRCADTNNIPF